MGPTLKNGRGGHLSGDATQHSVMNSAPTCWALPVGICRNRPRSGGWVGGWSWTGGPVASAVGPERGERPVPEEPGKAIPSTGTTKTKAFPWAHSFKLQQEAIRKNN